jgi:hypothetical protein
MRPETRELGRIWVNNCLEANSDNQLIHENFINFVNASLERKETISSFDISILIKECNKDWNVESKKDFLSKWLSEYKKIIQEKIIEKLEEIKQHQNNFSYTFADELFTVTLDVNNEEGNPNKVILAIFSINLNEFQKAINQMKTLLNQQR